MRGAHENRFILATAGQANDDDAGYRFIKGEMAACLTAVPWFATTPPLPPRGAWMAVPKGSKALGVRGWRAWGLARGGGSIV